MAKNTRVFLIGVFKAALVASFGDSLSPPIAVEQRLHGPVFVQDVHRSAFGGKAVTTQIDHEEPRWSTGWLMKHRVNITVVVPNDLAFSSSGAGHSADTTSN